MEPSRSRLAVAAIVFVTPLSLAQSQVVSRLGVGGATAATSNWQPQIAVTGELVSPTVRAMRTSLHGSFAHVAGAKAAVASELMGGLQLSSTTGWGGWWVGGEAIARRWRDDVVERPRVTSGVWRRFGDLMVSVSASRRSALSTTTTYGERRIQQAPLIRDTLGRIDTTFLPDIVVHDTARRSDARRWSETEASLSWERRRWSASVAVGGRLPSQGVPRGIWASADLAVALRTPISLVVGASVSPGARLFPASEHRFVTLGLRVAPRFFRSPAMPVPSLPLPTTFGIDTAGGGRYRITLRVPSARSVELSGDFTGWKPVSLMRTGGDHWSVILPISRGAHRLNIRIDRGPWIAPPGVVTTSDDYAGEVGLLVIDEPRREQK